MLSLEAPFTCREEPIVGTLRLPPHNCNINDIIKRRGVISSPTWLCIYQFMTIWALRYATVNKHTEREIYIYKYMTGIDIDTREALEISHIFCCLIHNYIS